VYIFFVCVVPLLVSTLPFFDGKPGRASNRAKLTYVSGNSVTRAWFSPFPSGEVTGSSLFFVHEVLSGDWRLIPSSSFKLVRGCRGVVVGWAFILGGIYDCCTLASVTEGRSGADV
jgi:hypothetical protein